MGHDSPDRPSPLADRHRGLGARMTSFAGWHMPLDYGSTLAEHRTVREACGVFDLSHLGMFTVTGEGAVDALQHAFTNDAAGLARGRAHYTLCCDDGGGIVDDLLLYRFAWGFLVICNAANVDAVRAAVTDGPGDPTVADRNGAFACLAVQGPDAADVALAAGLDVRGLAFLDCRALGLASPGAAAADTGGDDGFAEGVLARTGYTGERGYEVVVPAERAGDLWDRLLAAGDVSPAGLGARDLLRLEMGYPLHGNDIDRTTTPVEAGLWFAVAPDTDFRGAPAVRRAREDRPPRRMRGLVAGARGVPRAGQAVRRDDVEVGRTTSGSLSPTLQRGVALAYLDRDVALGDEVVVDVRGRALPAEVVRPPFVDADPRD